MKTFTVSIVTPNKTEHERIIKFMSENKIKPISEALTKDIEYSFVLVELTESQYSDLIDLEIKSIIRDLT